MTRTPDLSILLLLAISLGLGSCATMLNRETQEIRITTGKNISGVSARLIHSSSIVFRPISGR